MNAVMEIEEWWPRVIEAVRVQLINDPINPVAPFCIDEVVKAGGPDLASGWWQPIKGWESEVRLPTEAIKWIGDQPDTEALRREHVRDPRADHFKRGWQQG